MIRTFGAVALLALANAATPVVAQPARYSASGTHQCPRGSCVVTGVGFNNCNQAGSYLRQEDCCPTTRNGGRSMGFFLNYCIAERGR